MLKRIGSYLSLCTFLGFDHNNDLSHCDLSGLHTEGDNFSKFDMSHVFSSSSVFLNCNFSGAIMTGADFRGSQFIECDFSYSDLTGADLRDCEVNGSIFSYADMNGTQISADYFSREQLKDSRNIEYDEVLKGVSGVGTEEFNRYNEIVRGKQVLSDIILSAIQEYRRSFALGNNFGSKSNREIIKRFFEIFQFEDFRSHNIEGKIEKIKSTSSQLQNDDSYKGYIPIILQCLSSIFIVLSKESNENYRNFYESRKKLEELSRLLRVDELSCAAILLSRASYSYVIGEYSRSEMLFGELRKNRHAFAMSIRQRIDDVPFFKNRRNFK